MSEFIGPRLPRALRQRHREEVLAKKDARNRRFPPRFADVDACMSWWKTQLTMMGYTDLVWWPGSDVAFAFTHDRKGTSAMWEITIRGAMRHCSGDSDTARAIPGGRRTAFDMLIQQLDARREEIHREQLQGRDKLIGAVLDKVRKGAGVQLRPEYHRLGEVLAIGRRDVFKVVDETFHQLEVIVRTPDDRIIQTMVSTNGTGDLRISSWAKTFLRVRNLLVTPGNFKIWLNTPNDVEAVDRPYALFIAFYEAASKLTALKTILTVDIPAHERSRAISTLAEGWRYYPAYANYAVCPSCLTPTVPVTHVCAKASNATRILSYEVSLRVEVDADAPGGLQEAFKRRLHEMTAPGTAKLLFTSTKQIA